MPSSIYNNRIARPSITFTIPASSTAAVTATGTANGLLRGFTVKAATLDANATITVAILDADGTTLLSKASIATASNAQTFVGIDANNQPLVVPLSGAYTASITPSGSSAAPHNIVLNLLIDKF